MADKQGGLMGFILYANQKERLFPMINKEDHLYLVYIAIVEWKWCLYLLLHSQNINS